MVLNDADNGLARLIRAHDKTADVLLNHDSTVSVFLSSSTTKADVDALKIRCADYIGRNMLQDSYKKVTFYF